MTINIKEILIIVVFGSLFFWGNNELNPLPIAQKLLKVVIVAVAVVLLIASLFGGFDTHIRIN